MARKPKRQTLDDAGVLALKAKPKRYAHPDPEQRGHYIRIQRSGAKTFVVVARNLEGKQIWTTIGEVGLISIEEAREKARETSGPLAQAKTLKGRRASRLCLMIGFGVT